MVAHKISIKAIIAEGPDGSMAASVSAVAEHLDEIQRQHMPGFLGFTLSSDRVAQTALFGMYADGDSPEAAVATAYGWAVTAINAADDERNPPETGVTEAALKRVKNGRLYLIPASSETRGHLTTCNAAFYKQQLRELLRTAPQRAM